MTAPTVPQLDPLSEPNFFGEGKAGADRALELAREQVSQANAYIRRLGALQGGLGLPVINPSFPTPTAAPAISIPPVPNLDEIVWVAPPFPSPLSATLDVSDVMPMLFEDEQPEMVLPGAPDEFVDGVPDAPGVDLQVEYPELSLTLPEPPALMSLSISRFDGVNIPSFDEEVPELRIAEPGQFVYTPGAMYTSALLSSLSDTLRDRIVNGGTGLRPEVENAIWDRGRDREARAKRDALDALDQMGALGYALPPGIWLDARLKIETETEYTNVTISREIMIEQAKLEQTNVLKALEEANRLEAKLIDSHNLYEQRLFEAARYASQAGIEIYNAKVRAYAAYVDAFKVKATIYEARLRGELAKVEVYKTLVETESIKAQVNRALVDQYRAQIEAALANVEVFKARIGAIQAKAEIERLKVSIYGEQVRGYVARINAYTARVDAYKTVVSAEATKQDAFRARVQAFSARVDAQSKVIDARIKEFQGRIDGKQLEYEGYKAYISAESARVQSISLVNQSRVEGYRALVSGTSAYNETLTKQWQASIDIGARIAEMGIAAAKANAELYVTTRNLVMEASKVGAQVSAQLGAAALNAINYNNSISYSTANSTSRSGSASDSHSKSTSESVSENTNYNLSA